MCILYGALHPAFGLRPSQIDDLAKDGGAPNTALPKGLTSLHGGHYIQRDQAEEPRPEAFDRLARSRLWQRTLEDVKAKERGLANDLPGHPAGVF